MKNIRITVLVDNNSLIKGLEKRWGLSIYVEAYGHRFLFDTDTDPQALSKNAQLLNIDLSKTEFIIISHSHGDHTGGLKLFSRIRSGITVFFPAKSGLDRRIRELGLIPAPVHETRQVLDNVYIIGELRAGFGLWEQALGIKKDDKLIVITGCCHPGVDNIVTKALREIGGKLFIVIGGFHSPSKQALDNVLRYNPWKIYPLHCSGYFSIDYIRRKDPERIGIGGAGLVIVI